MPEMLAVHRLPEVLDAGGVLADQQLRQVLDRADDRAGVPFERRLAPTDEARLVRLNLDEDPIAHPRVTDQGANCGDFHGESINARRTGIVDGKWIMS
jgi:hypothetical protein